MITATREQLVGAFQEWLGDPELNSAGIVPELPETYAEDFADCLIKLIQGQEAQHG